MIKLGNSNIGKIYLGSTAIGKAYFGSNLVYSSDSGPGPQPTMIPYIRGGADGSYIDTGITPNSTTRVIVWARNFNPMAGANTIFLGSRNSDFSNSFQIYAGTNASTGKIQGRFGGKTAFSTESDFRLLGHYHKYELNANGFFVDDVLVAQVSVSSMSNNYSIYLFKSNNAGVAGGSSDNQIDICACQIYKGGFLVRDYSAVNSPSVGLYDAISQTLFTNEGTGSFTYGEFDKNAYTPLEYIECDGNQYFDSLAYGSYAGGIVVNFMPTNDTAKWTSVLGYRIATNCCDIALGTNIAGEDNMRLYWRLGTNTDSVRAFDGSSSSKLTGKPVVAMKSNNILYTYYNGSQIGSATKNVSSTFRTSGTLAIGTIKTGSETYNIDCFIGKIYYVGLASDRSFVPAKKGSRVGMYDTYNDVFYQSATDTPFIAGQTI